MNEELLATSVFFIQRGASFDQSYWFTKFFGNCPMFSQPKSAVHQQPAKLFQQHWQPLKVNYDLNSAFENSDY
jgi:hypothetical protein